MNNNITTHRSPCSGNVTRGRKRKAVEDVDRHEMVARSNPQSGGFNHESRIVRVSRSSGGKDRHSKVLTAKGLRDRRVRLSVSTAIQFYDLQDRLCLDQPSKAVEWLLKAASHAIDELPVLDHPFHGTFSNAPRLTTNTDANTVTITKVGDAAAGAINVFAESTSNNDSPSSKEGHQGQCELIQSQQKQQQQQRETAFGKGKMTSSKSSIEENGDEADEGDEDQDGLSKHTYYSALSLSRSEPSSRVKARERPKKRAKENFQFQIPAVQNNQDADNDGTRDSFTGLLHSVAHAALESRDIPQSRRSTSLSMNILQNDLSQSHSHSHTHSLPPATTPPSLDHLFHDQSHILHSASLMQQQSYGSQSFTFPTFVNAAILGPISLQRNEVSKPSGIFCTSQDNMHHHNHHSVGNTPHFTSIPNIQQHASFVDQEDQQAVPITAHDHINMMSFSMPGLAGRETLQSNSFNNMPYHLTQRIQPVEASSMFTTTRNVQMQGGFDSRVLQRSMKDLGSESSGSPAFKCNTKRENHYK